MYFFLLSQTKAVEYNGQRLSLKDGKVLPVGILSSSQNLSMLYQSFL